ncbi:hypothetical protein GCM10008967_30730 [Bacillus carboniphilus]|uniref:SLAP domain-containing protein n=1 Tax=Bacillus carboniphilus TaxID=86663 RepID=A0ABP3G7K8_9BACI
MQKLKFEASWDKAISEQDREQILNVFKETHPNGHDVEFTPLWQAVNHKGELLVTVLVQNYSGNDVDFHNKKLRYTVNQEMVAAHTFTIPALVVEGETSMPWTFIFPVESLKNSDFEGGTLHFVE